MALEALAWPQPPTFLDLEDGVSYNMGVRFQVTEPLPCVGICWSRVPTTLGAPAGGDFVASLWNEDNEQLARVAFVPVAGSSEQQILFAAPFALLPGVNYVAAIYTIRYVFRASGGEWPSSPSGKVVANIGRLVAYNGGPDVEPDSAPSGSSAGLFYIGPLVDLGGDPDPEEHITNGTASLTLAATAAVGTSRPTTGAGPLVLGASAARSTARSTTGTASLTATASGVRSTSRATAGSAALGVGASAVRSTARGTSGAARLLLSARGEQVRAGGGPRLVTQTQVGALTSASRPGVITTDTRG